MASASSLPCEEQLLCSICLDVFTEPVSTPCGHNYCKTCITGYWSSSDLIQCPLCKKRFSKKTQLQVNTGFRDMVEHFNKMRVRGEDDAPATPGEVTCDICLEPKLRAQKTCLVCLASYCQSHLEPHQRVQTLKKHQLIEPVSNLEDRVCKKHDKMFELFCREDQMYICVMCLKDNHATHEAVPLEQAFRERKDQLEYVITQLKIMENTKSSRIKEIKHFVKRVKREDSEKEIADIAEVFATLVASLLRSQGELIEVIQEKQKAAEKEAEDHVTQLEQEVADLRRKRAEMEQLFQTEDHLNFLQSRLFSSHSKDLSDLLSSSSPAFTPDLYVSIVQKAVAQMEKTLSNEMQKLIHEVRLSDGFEAAAQPPFTKEEWTPPRDKLMMIQQNDAVDVTLDSYTANSKLVVSDNGKQLRFQTGSPFLIALSGGSFERQPLILGTDGFCSGRFYYEVRVSESKGWLLGVVKESINREILYFPTPEDGGWTFFNIYNSKSQIQDQYFGNTDGPTQLHLRKKPQTVGVFVDYEKAEVSFYDVDARSLIFSYTRCSFLETRQVLNTPLCFISRPKLYPIFGIFENDYDNRLQITPVV